MHVAVSYLLRTRVSIAPLPRDSGLTLSHPWAQPAWSTTLHPSCFHLSQLWTNNPVLWVSSLLPALPVRSLQTDRNMGTGTKHFLPRHLPKVNTARQKAHMPSGFLLTDRGAGVDKASKPRALGCSTPECPFGGTPAQGKT